MINCAGATRKYVEELTEEKSYSVMPMPLSIDSPVSNDRSCFFSWHGQGWKGRGEHCHKRKSLGREWTDSELFIHLLILNCLHLKIIFNDCLRLYWVLMYEEQQKLKKEPIYSFIQYIFTRSYQCARHLARS